MRTNVDSHFLKISMWQLQGHLFVVSAQEAKATVNIVLRCERRENS